MITMLTGHYDIQNYDHYADHYHYHSSHTAVNYHYAHYAHYAHRDPGALGEAGDEREQRVRGERRRLVRVRPHDRLRRRRLARTRRKAGCRSGHVPQHRSAVAPFRFRL